MRISQSSVVNTVLIDIHDYREHQKCGFRQASMQQMAQDIRGCFGPEVPVRYDSKYKNTATDLMAAKSPKLPMLRHAWMAAFSTSLLKLLKLIVNKHSICYVFSNVGKGSQK